MTITASVVQIVRSSVRYILRRPVKNDPEARLHPSLTDEAYDGENSFDDLSTKVQGRMPFISLPTTGYCDVPEELLTLRRNSSLRTKSSTSSSSAYSQVPPPDNANTLNKQV